MADVVIGVDSSTQSCTVEVRDAVTGERVAEVIRRANVRPD